MARQLEKEIDKLVSMVRALGARVEKSLAQALKAAVERDAKIAARVIEADDVVDEMEVEVEEECLKILALHQPVAIDLRYIVAFIKLNNDLERVGDLAVNVAERAAYLAEHPGVALPSELEVMAQKAQGMFRQSLQALVAMDMKLAGDICAADDEVDEMHRDMYAVMQRKMEGDTANIEGYLHILAVSRYLERVADHATNIAEDVIYLVEGEIRRHKAGLKK